MATINNVPRDILESMRDNLDRRIKLSIKRMVNYETRKEKWENRVLAFSPYRLFVFTAKSPTKVESSVHYLDIESIESKKPNHLVITTTTKTYTFSSLESGTDEINHMITHIGTSLKTVFPCVNLEKLIKKVEVQPSDRIRVMYDMMKSIGLKEMGPCGGFTHMYACMCDFHGLVYRDEVAWDVDTIYLSQDSRELCLRDFDHLKERDLVPIVSALIHNNWFISLNANNVRLTQDVCNEILRLVKKNEVIECLLLSGTGISTDFIKKLATMSMSGTALHQLDLSNNMIDDIGAEHIFGSLSSRGKLFTMIDLSRTKVTSKGLNKIAESMNRSPHVFSSLQTLKLTHLTSNKADDMQNMYSFLAAPNMLSHLDLTATDFELERLMAPLLRGCSQSIVCLKLSKLPFTSKKTKEVIVPPSFKQFFSSVYSLKHLDLSGARLPPEALKDLLLGISINRNLSDLHIDISGIDLVSQGPQYLQNCLSDVSNVSSLNISNIAFQDQDLIGVLQSIGQNKSIKQLSMGRVFQIVKPKNLQAVMDELVRVIQEEDAVLESLSLADSKLKDSMNTIINALGSNSSLTEVDISGNLMGDLGARMLSKALQINNKLKTIVWDKNCTGCQGFEDIADALEKNYTLKKMPMPVYDASAALRANPERTEQALQTIERLLQRNHSPHKYSSDQAYRLQQGFLISSTQQMVDRLVVQSQDTINALTMGSLEPHSADVEIAKLLIKDADRSKVLLPRLRDIADQSQNAGSPVEMKLKEISVELKSVLEEQIKGTVTSMLESTGKQCKTMMRDQVLVSELKAGCKERSIFPKDFTKNVLDGVDTDIFNKLSELNLAVAAHISDRIIDEVIERLTKSHKTLTDHLNQKKKDMQRGQSKKMEENETNLRTKDMGSPHSSPKIQSKRKSMHARKLRPQSVIDREQNKVVSDQNASTQGKGNISKSNKTPTSGSRSPKKPIQPKVKSKNKKESKAKSSRSTSTPDISTKSLLTPKKSSSASNSPRSTSPLPKIEVTYENIGQVDLDDDLDPLYDNAVGVNAHALETAKNEEFNDVLDSDTDKPSPEKPTSAPATPSNELIESFDDVPELPSVTKLSHATKNRPKRPKNVRPSTRQSALTTTTEAKVDEDVESFFSPPSKPPLSGPSITSSNKGDESPKNSSTKSTPETRKKSGGLFGFGNKDGKEKDKDKEQKKTGGLSGLFKKAKPSPPPVANKRMSNVQEEDDDKSSNNSSFRRSETENSSLQSSLNRKQSDRSAGSSSARESLNSEKSSIKGGDTLDGVSIKSTGSTDTKGSDNKETEVSNGSEKETKKVEEKKALVLPKNKRSFSKADDVQKVEEEKNSVLLPKTKTSFSKADDVKKGEEEKKLPVLPKTKTSFSKADDVKKGEEEKKLPVLPKTKTSFSKADDVKKGEEEKKLPVLPKTKTSFSKADDVKKVVEEKSEVVSKEGEEKTELGEAKTGDNSDQSKEGEKSSSDKTGANEEEASKPPEPESAELTAPVVPKRPGAPGIGFGINIMAEMKEKQKRKSMMPNANPSPNPQPDPSPKQETKEPLFGLKNLRHSGDRDNKVKQKESDDKHSAKKTDSGKPSDTDGSSIDIRSSVKSDSEERKSTASDLGNKEGENGTDKPADKPTTIGKKPSINGDKPAVALRQGLRPPPMKPKPPGNKPKPAPRTSLSQSEDTEITSPGASSKDKDAKQDSGIVYDSATLKMSVKDKLAKKFGETVRTKIPKNEESSPKPSLPASPLLAGKKDVPPPLTAKPDLNKGDSLPRESTPEEIDKGVSLSQDDLQACDLDLKSDSSSDMTDSGIVYDSDTLKMSVKDKASNLFGETVQKKSGSLTRDSKPSDMKDETSVAPKRPRSMFAVIDNRPDLKNKVEADRKSDIEEEKSENVENKDTNSDDKTDAEDQHSPTDVVMV